MFGRPLDQIESVLVALAIFKGLESQEITLAALISYCERWRDALIFRGRTRLPENMALIELQSLGHIFENDNWYLAKELV